MRLLRLLIAEKFLGWALAIMPENSSEAVELALFLNQYCQKRVPR